MRISELAERSGTSVATIKYYLREGLLHPGVAVNARQAAFDETHLARVRLVRGLVHVLGASISQVREVLAIIGDRDQTVVQAMGRATAALPATGSLADTGTGGSGGGEGSPDLAMAVLDELGFTYAADSSVVEQLDSALSLAAEAGVTIDPDQIRAYAAAARDVAAADFARVPWGDPGAALEFAVLGTALYEPVLLALRRIAHYERGLEIRTANNSGGVGFPAPPATQAPADAGVADSANSVAAADAPAAPAAIAATDDTDDTDHEGAGT
ncbi:MerR family transcriptional regulator [Myceligenerans indicum]|uniref:MerR family transcriptional regulator n=1 Tax=Myceligenerans indicum TaxID=2593663 RepID=A0ABS1LQK0_9MICO|nr:MerR family transcriptional regulator [Myceligenerans indicum]MBL0888515.1 MerR family transcriptional regulator [Myceligenerans indicum]